MKKGYNWLIVCVTGILVALLVVIVTIFVIPVAIEDQVTKTIELNNGSDAWTRWVDLPVPIQFKVYFFEVQNPWDVINGAKPILKEKGPYVYQEKRFKTILGIDEKMGTITYNQTTVFTFDRSLSVGSDNDIVQILHPFLVGMAQLVESFPVIKELENIIDFALPDILGDHQNAITNMSVHSILFDGVPLHCNNSNANGATLLLCSAFDHLLPLKLIYPIEDNNFGFQLLKYKNNTLDGPYVAYSGTKDIKKLGKIISYQGKQYLDAWGGDPCNLVKGSDIALLPPFLDIDTDLDIFNSDVCGTVPLHYVGRATYKDVHGLRFGPKPLFLSSVQEFKEAYCYNPGSCKGLSKKNALLKGGIWDVTGCLGLPSILSYPHLHQAPSYNQLVDGLNYTASEHETFIDVEPTTGTPLRGYQRVQINLMTKPTPQIKRLSKMPTAVIPILWIDEGLDLPDDLLQIVRDQLLKVLKIVDIIQWTLIGVGLLMATVGCVMADYYLLKPPKIALD